MKISAVKIKVTAFLTASVLTVVGFQNCSNPVAFTTEESLSNSATAQATSLGLVIMLVPNPENANEVGSELKYTLQLSEREHSSIEIKVDDQIIQFVQNEDGNASFSFTPDQIKRYPIYAEVVSQDGKKVTASLDVDIRDERAPEVTVTPSSSNSYGLNQPVSFDVAVTDVGGGSVQNVRCLLDGVEIPCNLSQNGDGTITVNQPSSGNHTLVVQAVDSYENESTKEVTFSVAFDELPPVVSITPAAANKYYTINRQVFNVQIKELGSGIKQVVCYLDNQAFNCPTVLTNGYVSVLATTEGNHELRIAATDNAGNVGSNSYSYTLNTDTKAPIVKLAEATSNTHLLSQPQYASVVISETGSGLASYACYLNNVKFACSLSGGTSGSIKFTPTVAGTQTLRVDAVDKYGNTGSSTLVFDMVVDKDAPVLTLKAATTNEYLLWKTLKFNLTVKDLGGTGISQVKCFNGTVEVGCNFSASTGTGVISVSYKEVGQKVVKIRAVDKVGNVSTRSLGFEVKALVTRWESFKSTKKVDVLFVVDNSVSMKEEQINMARKVGKFVEKLAGTDWRAAVTTTDLVAHNGALLPIRNMGNTYFVSSQMNATNAQTNLGQTIEGVGLQGNFLEQGIRATYRAVMLRDKAPHVNFFRPDAGFAVILISDEDESGTDWANQPENLVALVKKTWPQKAFSFSSIIKDTPTCSWGTLGQTYIKMSNLTGNGVNGGAVIGCVGATDYTDILAKVGANVRLINNTVTLKCNPYSGAPIVVKKDGVVYTGKYIISGQTMSFEAALPLGNYTVSYKCLP